MTLDEMATVIQAAIEGKTIQWQFLDSSSDCWSDMHNLSADVWQFHLYRYRVKPEPIEVWINVYPDQRFSPPHRNQNYAMATCNQSGRTVKFREVIE